MKAGRGVILIVVLALGMVGLWLWVLGIIPIKKTVRELIERPVTVEVSPEELKKKAEETALSLSNWLEKQEKMDKMLVYHKGPRDPFFPPVKEKVLPARLPKLVLKGIAWDETSPLASINDLVVKEGDIIGDVKVVKIYFDRVVVEYNFKRFVINLVELEEEEK